MNLIDSQFEIKEMSESGTFSGYGSVYGNTDQGDDIVAPGCFAKSLTDWTAKGRMPALLWQHNQREPIGAYTKMAEDANGLYVEGKLAIKTQRGLEAYELMKMNAISGLSVGFMSKDDYYDQKTGIRTIKQGDLMEVSLVTFPMNDSARVAQVKSIESLESLANVERYLRESGSFSKGDALAMVTRIKSLARSESAEQMQVAEIMASLKRQAQILRG
jgi:HK97 family phage prohead protease